MRPLRDTFNSPIGFFDGWDPAITPWVATNKHVDLRSFYNYDISRARTQQELDALTQEQLNAMSQRAIERVITLRGEYWSVTGDGFVNSYDWHDVPDSIPAGSPTCGAIADLGNWRGLTLTTTADAIDADIVSSILQDDTIDAPSAIDISEDAIGVGATLSLIMHGDMDFADFTAANSFIQLSSATDGGFDDLDACTAEIAFTESASLEDTVLLLSVADVVFGAGAAFDLTQVRGVKIHLEASAGTADRAIHLLALRMLGADWTWESLDMETRRSIAYPPPPPSVDIPAYESRTLALEPIAWYRMSEGDTQTMLDHSGNDRHLTVSHPDWWTPSVEPSLLPWSSNPAARPTLYARTFDADLNPPEFTTALLFKLDIDSATGFDRSLVHNSGSPYGWRLQITTSGHLRAMLGTNGGLGSETLLLSADPISEGDVHSAVLTYDGTTACLYLDGSLETSEVTTYAPLTATQTMQLNSTAVIDEVILTDYALTSDEVSTLYAQGVPGVTDLSSSGILIKGVGDSEDFRLTDGSIDIHFSTGGGAVESGQNSIALLARESDDADTLTRIQFGWDSAGCSLEVAREDSGTPAVLIAQTSDVILNRATDERIVEVIHDDGTDYLGYGVDDDAGRYCMRTTLVGNNIEVRILPSNARNAIIGPAVATFDVTNTSLLPLNGRVGIQTNFLDRDAFIDEIRPGSYGYATLRTLPAASYTPVDGAQLIASASQPENLFRAWQWLRPQERRIDYGNTRSGLGASVATVGLMSNPIWIRDWTKTSVHFDLWITDSSADKTPTLSLQSLLSDEDGNPIIMKIPLPSLRANQWNPIAIDLGRFANQHPGVWYTLAIEGRGEEFAVDSMRVDQVAVDWAIRADEDQPWRSFGNLTNAERGAVHLGRERGKAIQLQATALTRDAWISHLRLLPRYAQLGLPLYDESQDRRT